jgi:hypothetical protein
VCWGGGGLVKVQAWWGLKGEVLKVGKDVGGLIVGGLVMLIEFDLCRDY